MHTKQFGRYPARGKWKKMLAIEFFILSFLSLALVVIIASLTRAELRLTGNILAADGDELVLLDALQPFSNIELVRESENLRLYLLRRDGKEFLAEVVKEDGKWKVRKVERLRR